MTFYVDPATTASSIFRQRDASEVSNAIRVGSITLDELYRPGQRTFVKIDIEGAEVPYLAVLQAFSGIINTTFLIELHPWEDPERKRYPLHLGAMMVLNGYKMTKIVPHYFFRSHYIFTKSTRLSGPRIFGFLFLRSFLERVRYRLIFPENTKKIIALALPPPPTPNRKRIKRKKGAWSTVTRGMKRFAEEPNGDPTSLPNPQHHPPSGPPFAAKAGKEEVGEGRRPRRSPNRAQPRFGRNSLGNDFSDKKRFGKARGSIALDAAQPQQRPECLLVEPLSSGLRWERLEQSRNLVPTDIL